MHMLYGKRGDRVAAEAAALETGRLPGVVELVDVHEGTLRTRMVEGARPLAEVGPLSPDEIAGVLASVASTVAELHERGVVHGGIDASHVLVREDGRPVLCSLGRGGQAADDVAALGRLVTELLEAARPAAGDDGTQERRGRLKAGRTRLGPLLAPPASPVLADLAAAVAGGEARPTARELAALVHQRIPTARLPAGPGRAPLLLDRPPVRRRRRPWTRPPRPRAAAPGPPRRWSPHRPVLVGFGTVTAVAVGALALVPLPDHDAPAAAARPGTTSTSTSTPAAEPAPAEPVAGPAAVRVWPTEPVDFRDGVLAVNGARYSVGQPGDAAVVGDWACTGEATLALLRPVTGAVYAFDRWAGGDEVVGRLVGTVAGAERLRVADRDGDGCDDLEVEVQAGDPVLLDPSTAAPAAAPSTGAGR